MANQKKLKQLEKLAAHTIDLVNAVVSKYAASDKKDPYKAARILLAANNIHRMSDIVVTQEEMDAEVQILTHRKAS